MKAIFKVLVYSNLWVGLAVSALAAISSFGLFRFNFFLLVFIGCATALAYSYMRLVQLPGYQKEEISGFKAWYARNPALLAFITALWGVLSYFSLLQILSVQLMRLLSFPAAVSLIYPLSFKNPMAGFTSLRSYPGLKLFLIAMVWSYVTAALPALLVDEFSTEMVLEFIFRTFLIMSLTIPFDIRDITSDQQEMDTIPQRFGIINARQISTFLLMLYQIWVAMRILIFDFDPVLGLTLILGLEIGFWIIRRANTERGELYYSFWLEGVPIFTFVLMWLAWRIF